MIREYPYTIVPDSYRRRVTFKPRKNHQKITNKVVIDLLAGKTLLVDAEIPIQTRNGFPKEFRTLYNTFASRGYRLHVYMYDDIDKDIYRALLMWAEPMMKMWICSRCSSTIVTSPSSKPATKNCKSTIGFHFWKGYKPNIIVEDGEEEVAAQERRIVWSNITVSKTVDASSNLAGPAKPKMSKIDQRGIHYAITALN